MDLVQQDTKYNWVSIIPLIGGQTLGAYNITKIKPRYILSNKQFMNTERILQKVFFPDVHFYYLENFIDHKIEFGNIDFVNTLCPCAGLSELNPGKNSELARGADAQQNNWMYLTAEYILQNVKPKVFYGENTDNLFAGKVGNEVSDRLYEIAKKYGYSFSLLKTDARLHGVPQKRERTFYFFWNTQTVPGINYTNLISHFIPSLERELLDPNYLIEEQQIEETKRLRQNEYFNYLKEWQNLDIRDLYVDKPITMMEIILQKNLLDDFIYFLERGSNDKILQKIKHIKQKLADGKEFWDDSPIIVRDYTNAAITRNINTIHPTVDRFLTIGEWIKLMRMPFEIIKELPTRRTSYTRLFQNVPVKVSEDIVEHVILPFLNGNFRQTNYTYSKYNLITGSGEFKGKINHNFF